MINKDIKLAIKNIVREAKSKVSNPTTVIKKVEEVQKVPGKIEVKPVVNYLDNVPLLSYFNGVNPTKKGDVTIRRFLKAIKNPKGKNKELLNEIEKCRVNGDTIRKSKLKEQLTTFTVGARCSYRNYDSIIEYTGIVVLDFDGFEKRYDNPMEQAIIFKQLIFELYPQIIASWVSPSAGVKALIRIPICKTKEEYDKYAAGVGAEFQIYQGFDQSSLIAIQACFIGGDKEILIRENPKMWTTTGHKLGAEYKKGKVREVKISGLSKELQSLIPTSYYKTDKEYREIVYKIFLTGVMNIDVDTEVHPQIRDLSFALGGYVGGGYISEDEAVALLNNTIDDNLHTFSKHDSNGDVYRTTGRQAIANGSEYPIKLV